MPLGQIFRNVMASAVTAAAVNRPAVEHYNVIEITGSQNLENASFYPVHTRQGCLVLHWPCDMLPVGPTRAWKYNIILHVPYRNAMFSLFRSDDETEAIEHYTVYKETFPILVPLDSSICQKSHLENICSLLRANKSWGGVHVAAALGLVRCLQNSSMKPFINEQEGKLLRTPLHIAILHDQITSVKTLLSLGVQMDLKDVKDNTIFHLAALKSNAILKALLEELPERYGFLIDDLNAEGYNPLHMACFGDKSENVKCLLSSGANINISSAQGSNPIHLAVRERSVCCIQELVKNHPNQLSYKDVQLGGTPLHWANGPEIINTLLELGCDPNLTNNLGNSPLHTAAERGCLKSILTLISHNVFLDLKGEQGDTALHIAARRGHKAVIQALVVFGSDINTLNNLGHSPRHLVATSLNPNRKEILYILHAIGAKRCYFGKESCTDGCGHGKNFNGVAPNHVPHSIPKNILHDAMQAIQIHNQFQNSHANVGTTNCNSNETSDHFMKEEEVNQTSSLGTSTTRLSSSVLPSKPVQSPPRAHVRTLLSLDGGGIRGLVLTQMLLVIEQELGKPLIDVFDFVAGTSTGGVLALGLACGKSIVECQTLYFKLKDKVFTGSRPYSADLMEEFLKGEFGTDKTLASIKKPNVMVMTTLVNRRPAELNIFRNYTSPAFLIGAEEAYPTDPALEYVWKTAKVAGAAPSYFRLDHDLFIDGGIIANNPTMDALTEMQQINAVQKVLGGSNWSPKFVSHVLSLGTGLQPKTDADASSLDITWPSGILDALRNVPRLSSLINLLVDQATLSEGQVVERARAWCSSMGVPYFRFSPPMPEFIDLDENDDTVLINMMWQTRAYMYANMEVVHSFVKTIISIDDF